MLNLLIIGKERVRMDFGELDTHTEVQYMDDLRDAFFGISQNPCRYDAVFFAVDLKGHSTELHLLQLREIRRVHPYIPIILTSSGEWLPARFLELGNIYFLKKPLRADSLEKVFFYLRYELHRWNLSERRLLLLRSNRKNYVVSSDTVLYARKRRNGVIVVAEGQEYHHTCRLDEFEKSLTRTFCRCHSSYIVNFRHVVRFDSDFILMDNRKMISVSRAYRKNVFDFAESLSHPQDDTDRTVFGRDDSESIVQKRTEHFGKTEND